MHISVVLAKILKFEKDNIKQIWCFDYHEHGYESPDKELELAKRKAKRDSAKKQLKDAKIKLGEINKQSPEYLFSSDDGDDDIKEEYKINKCDSTEESKLVLVKKINQKEKECFSMNDQIINDCKFILDCLNIIWVTSPKGIEAEHVCAILTNISNIDNINFKVDAVFSTDADALLYGAKRLIREIKSKGKKVIHQYDLYDILKNNKINMDQLIKTALILGTDHAKKTPRIGPKTVLKKLETIELSDEQKKGELIFKKDVDISTLKFHNSEHSDVCQDPLKINKLIDWLVKVKGFNMERVKKQINKVYTGKL